MQSGSNWDELKGFIAVAGACQKELVLATCARQAGCRRPISRNAVAAAIPGEAWVSLGSPQPRPPPGGRRHSPHAADYNISAAISSVSVNDGQRSVGAEPAAVGGVRARA